MSPRLSACFLEATPAHLPACCCFHRLSLQSITSSVSSDRLTFRVAEYLTAEVLELAGNASKDLKVRIA